MKRCVLYTRVSTDAQERDGTSLDTQERAGLEFAASQGFTVVRTIRDAASGYHLDREGIESLRVMLRGGEVDVVVAYAVDRLSRNQNHIGVLFDEIQQADAKLEFVTERFEDTAVGRFILAARAFIAEVEREKIIERTMRGKAERARSGRLPQATGAGLFGYRYLPETGQREVVPEQAAAVQQIFERFSSGESLSGITKELNAGVVPTFTGIGPWRTWTVRNMLRNEAYVGRTIYRKTLVSKRRNRESGRMSRHVEVRPSADWIEVPGATPAIISEPLFLAVQQRLNDPERRRRGRRTHDYPLSGRMRCARCGSAMVGQTLSGSYRYYRCRRAFGELDGARCSSRYVPAPAVESRLLDEMVRVLTSPEVLVAELKFRAVAADNSQSRQEPRALELLARQHHRLLKLYQMGEIDDPYLERELEVLRARKAAMNLPQQQGDAQSGVTALDASRIEELCRIVAAKIREEAEGGRLDLILQALDITVTAQRNESGVEAVARGVIPEISGAVYSPLHEHRHDYMHEPIVPHRPKHTG